MDANLNKPFLAVPTSNTPTKSRSFSDPPSAAATLAPSPTIHEDGLRRGSKDDHAVPTTPKTIRRPDFARGLSLQMPGRGMGMGMSSPTQPQRAAPLSPQLDQHNTYSFMQSQSLSASPATSLPRHSRGLDFSRACTNLHHSTLPEKSTPDSSPVITQKAMNIPSRKMSVGSMALDSPHMGPGSTWGSLAPERSTVSSSVGSINMLASESESSESDEDASMAGDDNDDPIFATPQVHKLHNRSAPTPFVGPQTPNGSVWNSGNTFSPAAASLMKTIRRTRLQKNGKKTRKSSSSASNSGYSSMASPRTTSPPPMKSIESATNNGFFGWAKASQSRRESLALGTDGLHLSSNDSGDEASITAPATPGVIRRPVTRRGNLLPKTKGFARIRAALIEESAPVDTESRREAETIRQVRERDNSFDMDLQPRPQTATAQSSPNLLPAVPESEQEDFGKDLDGELNGTNRGLGVNFSLHASRNGGGIQYWNRFDPSMRTPPPPPSFARQSSSMMSDINMDTQPSEGDLSQRIRARAQSSASDASEAFGPSGKSAPAPAGMADDMHLKKFKRRREDDFDIATIKRRAVSPGMSSQNSPVLTQSPSHRDLNGTWGQPPERKNTQASNGPLSANSDISQNFQMGSQLHPVRSGSNGSNASMASGTTVAPGSMAGQGKKLGLQGMVDTNDGLMKMSIE